MASSQSWSTIFASQHYKSWRKQMETLFVSEDLWDVDDESYQELPSGEHDQLKHIKELKDASALRFIQQGVSKSLYKKIADCESAKDAWETLEDEFRCKDKEEVLARDSEWILDITVMLASLENKRVKASSISRVSDKLRQGIKEEADYDNDTPKIDPYSPNVVSMGPLRKETRSNDLQLMEETKWRCMRKLLFRDRTLSLREKIKNCSKEIRKIDSVVRASYGGNIDMKPEELARMMLLDGGFFLELLLRFYESTSSTVDDNNNDRFGDIEIFPILTDLTLLENQIPFTVLETILEQVSKGTNIFPKFDKLLDTLFHYNLNSSSGVFHFLHLLHSVTISDDDKHSHPYHATSKENGPQLKRCAARLLAFGIEIHPLDTETQTVAPALSKFMDKFDLRIDLKGGKLAMPPLRIKEGTEVRWRNLIALEQSRIGIAYKFTSYAMFLRGLICSVHDITLLKEKEVITIEDPKIRDKDLLVMLQTITNGVERMDDRYNKLCESLNTNTVDIIAMKHGRLCSHYCRLVLAWLFKVYSKRTFINVYSPNLWAFIGIVAATVLLVLTIMQTYYAARGN